MQPLDCPWNLPETLSRTGVTATSREKLGTITLAKGNDDSSYFFLQYAGQRALRSLCQRQGAEMRNLSETNPVPVDVLEEVLRNAIEATVRERESWEPTGRTEVTYSIFVMRIERTRAGNMFTKAELRGPGTFGRECPVNGCWADLEASMTGLGGLPPCVDDPPAYCVAATPLAAAAMS